MPCPDINLNFHNVIMYGFMCKYFLTLNCWKTEFPLQKCYGTVQFLDLYYVMIELQRVFFFSFICILNHFLNQGTMEKIAVTIAQNTSMVRIVNWIVVVKMLLAAPMRVESVFVVQVIKCIDL